jgi:hypothetical protein
VAIEAHTSTLGGVCGQLVGGGLRDDRRRRVGGGRGGGQLRDLGRRSDVCKDTALQGNTWYGGSVLKKGSAQCCSVPGCNSMVDTRRRRTRCWGCCLCKLYPIPDTPRPEHILGGIAMLSYIAITRDACFSKEAAAPQKRA